MEIYKNTDLEDLPGEIWKGVVCYEELYQVSNLGRVKSLKTKIQRRDGVITTKKEMILKQHNDTRGYLKVDLSKNNKNKNKMVHRLVAQAFISNPNNKETVNHINEIKTDNRVENLEWLTVQENNTYGTRVSRMQKSLSKTVLQYDLKGNFIKEWSSTREAGRNGYSKSLVSACCRGERKTHKSYIWKYKEEN